MSKNWYPIIDYKKCSGCLSCVKFCPHDVFKEENGKPVVVKPENCVEFCRGCQKGVCEHDAITYLETKRRKRKIRLNGKSYMVEKFYHIILFLSVLFLLLNLKSVFKICFPKF